MRETKSLVACVIVARWPSFPLLPGTQCISSVLDNGLLLQHPAGGSTSRGPHHRSYCASLAFDTIIRFAPGSDARGHENTTVTELQAWQGPCYAVGIQGRHGPWAQPRTMHLRKPYYPYRERIYWFHATLFSKFNFSGVSLAMTHHDPNGRPIFRSIIISERCCSHGLKQLTTT